MSEPAQQIVTKESTPPSSNKLIITTTNNETGETTVREVDVKPPPFEETVTTNKKTGETVVRRRGDIMTNPQTQKVYEKYQAGEISKEDVKEYVDSQLKNYGLATQDMILSAPEGRYYRGQDVEEYNRAVVEFNKKARKYRHDVLETLLGRPPTEQIEAITTYTVSYNDASGKEQTRVFASEEEANQWIEGYQAVDVGPPAPTEEARLDALRRREAGMPSMGLPMGQSRPGSLGEKLSGMVMDPLLTQEANMQSFMERIREPGVAAREASLRLAREGEPLLGLGSYLGGAAYEFGATILETASLALRPIALGKAVATPGLLLVDENYRSAMVESLLEDPFLFTGRVVATAATPWLLGKTVSLLKRLPGEPLGVKGLAQYGPDTTSLYPAKQWLELTGGKVEAVLKQANIAIARGTRPVVQPLRLFVSDMTLTAKKASIVFTRGIPTEAGAGLAQYGPKPFTYPLRQALQTLPKGILKPYYTSDLAGNLIFKADRYVMPKLGETLRLADLALARGALKFLRTPGIQPYAVDLAGGITWIGTTTTATSILGGTRAAFKFMTLPGIKAYEYSLFRGTPRYLKDTQKITSGFSTRDISGLLKLKAEEAAKMNAEAMEVFMKTTFKEPRGPVKGAPDTSAATLIQMGQRAAQGTGEAFGVFPFTFTAMPRGVLLEKPDAKVSMRPMQDATARMDQRLKDAAALALKPVTTQLPRLEQPQIFKSMQVADTALKTVPVPRLSQGPRLAQAPIITPLLTTKQVLKQVEGQQVRMVPLFDQMTRQNPATKRLLERLEPKPTGKKKGKRAGVYEFRVDFELPAVRLPTAKMSSILPKVKLPFEEKKKMRRGKP